MLSPLNHSPRIAVLSLTRSGTMSVVKGTSSHLAPGLREFRINDFLYSVDVSSTRPLPHGLDWDICGAIETLFFQRGCPDDNCLTVTPRALLLSAGMDDSGSYYVKLKKGLERLEGLSWVFKRGGERGTSTSTYTRIISEMTVYERSLSDQDSLIPESSMRIHLTPTFAGLIRQGLHQLLDAKLLTELKQPAARQMYRIMEGHRVQDDGTLASTLTVKFTDWCVACGIPLDRPDHARTTLRRAQAHLVNTGYLLGTTVTGRGSAQVLTFEFKPIVADAGLVRMLVEEGVQPTVAANLASNHAEHVEQAIADVHARLVEGYNPENVSGVIVDAVRNPGKYAQPFGGNTPPAARTRQRGGSGTARSAARSEAPMQELLAPSPESMRASMSSTLRMFLGRALTPQELGVIGVASEAQITDLSRSVATQYAAKGSSKGSKEREQLFAAFIAAASAI